MGAWIAVGAALASFAAYVFLISPGKRPANTPEALWSARYAHRGLHSRDRTVPENSLAAFAEAVRAGYGMELDVTLTSDGRVVVFHDDDLGRMCGVSRAVGECPYEELREYRLGGTEERIPLFSEVLDLVGGRTPLIVEIKSGKKNLELCLKTAELLDGYRGDYCVESFHPGIVRWFRLNRPHTVRGQLSAGARSFRELPKFQALAMSWLLVHAAGRPHFSAFRHEDSHGHPGLRLFGLMGGKRVGWTLREPGDAPYCLRFFNAVIFEFLCLGTAD